MAKKGECVGLTAIRVEKIHHLECKRCGASIDTNDCSHRLSREQAAWEFEKEGWRYKYMIGWRCPDCVIKNRR